MRQYKKKTIALCLASAITVLGAFGADSYSNSLVELQIKNSNNGKVNITVFTDKPMKGTVTTEKIDESMVYITLPETTSNITQLPDIKSCNNIESIQISTFPYTPEAEGYTRIYVKTKGNPVIYTNPQLYLTKNGSIDTTSSKIDTSSEKNTKPTTETHKKNANSSYWDLYNEQKPETKTSEVQKNTITSPVEKQTPNSAKKKEDSTVKYKEPAIKYQDLPSGNLNERIAIFVGIILVAFLVFFIYFLSKDKMTSIVGDQKEIDLDEENEQKNKKQSKRKKIRKAINKLDNQYKNIQSTSNINIVTGEIKNDIETNITTPVTEKESENETDSSGLVVDLDTLYKESQEENKKEEDTIEENRKQTEEEVVDDLAGFLDAFSFDEEINKQEIPNEEFDNELYEKIINDKTISFSKEDTELIKKLLQNEISEDTMNNIEEFAAKVHVDESFEIINKMENLIAEYTVKQNISFTKDDVDALSKLMSVEIDRSFITDLTTDPIRTEKLYKELKESKPKPHHTNEILTLRVKDLLPDLSKELAKQGKKPIKSDAKPQVVYFSEGYDVGKFSVDKTLSDISKALNSPDANIFRPSDKAPIVETGYDVDVLSVGTELPDLSDVKAHPNKYKEKEKPVAQVDEAALLNSISNVTFKPIYDDVQKELNQFEGFEIINDSDEVINDNEENVYKIDEETNISTLSKKEEEINIDAVPAYVANIDTPAEKKSDTGIITSEKTTDDAQKLIHLIEKQQDERLNKKQSITIKTTEKSKPLTNNSISVPLNCKIDGKIYNIIKAVKCNDYTNCYLAHGKDGYDVIGELNGEYKHLKHYESIRFESIQSRVNENLANGSIQYLIRAGIHKFIVNVSQNNMEFIMELC